MKFNRITTDPEVCTGKPCIRGLVILGSIAIGVPGGSKR
jgi:uncharacterized protein (DUF433 family)